MVFCGMFPSDGDQFEDLREALGKLQLNDAALSFEPEVGACSSLLSCSRAGPFKTLPAVTCAPGSLSSPPPPLPSLARPPDLCRIKDPWVSSVGSQL